MQMLILRLLLVSFSVCIAQDIFSQFALIQDKDGFVNIRENANTTKEPIDTLASGSIVWASEIEGNWTTVFYSKTDGIESSMGYIHTSRLLSVEKFATIPEKKSTSDVAVFYQDSFTVTVTTSAFVPSQYKLQYTSGEGGLWLKAINGKHIWGTDGGMPKQKYTGINVEWNGRKIEVPANALEDLFEPRLHKTKVNYDKETGRLYICAANSDAAGAYVAMWIFEKGAYQRRIVLMPQ